VSELKPMEELLNTLPQRGYVRWIGVRPARDEAMVDVDSAQLVAGKGVVGDRFKGRPGSTRQMTLIQYEHLSVIASCLGFESIEPALLRRNIVVSGINLLALKGKRFRIGGALLEYSGLAHPCSKMERLLGEGGYNAMRGHGGITARVCESGIVSINDVIFYSGDS
jgi:MOSC domain-containing protein YiiM